MVSPIQAAAVLPSTSMATSMNASHYVPVFPINDEYIGFLNKQLENESPRKILEWATLSLPNLYQTTAFGLSGLVVLDILSKIAADRAGKPGEIVENPIQLVFLDTLYHFDETLQLAQNVATHYKSTLHTFKPLNSDTREQFEALNGQKLWEADKEIYDYLVKVEPSRRSYATLKVHAVITGRRRSQAGSRSSIPIIEVDRAGEYPVIKLNPLAAWDFNQVMMYIRGNSVPYNPLLDQGYKSIGDVHSTRPTKEGENERDGRYEGKDDKECGLHKDYLKMRTAYVAAKKRKVALKSVHNGADDILVEMKPVLSED